MKPNAEFKNRSWMHFKNFMAVQLGVVLLCLAAATCLAQTHTVTNCTEADLRTAMTGGGTVTFACDGTITLANTITIATNTVLNASGHQVTISGNSAVRVFYVNTNVSLTVINLTIANGDDRNGAGIFNDGGMLNLQGVVMQNNNASEGGGVFSGGGMVNATNCVFRGNNTVLGFPFSRGGAIRNESGVLNLQNCSFTNNGAFDTSPWPFAGSTCLGGAIHNNGTLYANACTFIQNVAIGGRGSYGGGAPGGAGTGGAIYNLAVAVIESSTFSGNLAAGGNGTSGSNGPGPGGRGCGGAIYNLGKLEARMNSFFTNRVVGGVGGAGVGGGTVVDTGLPGGNGGAGGNAEGAALCNTNGGTVDLVNCTIAENTASGGSGGNGGTGGYGGRQGGNGGNGGNGGSGFGGVYDANGLISITNCTVALNSAQSGAGGSAGAGGSTGGMGHPGGPGVAGTSGLAAGGLETVGTTLLNTLLSANTPMNCSGSVTDAGHNLSSDGSCAFTHVGSLNDTDPNLGPLADNGGPTLTMALLPGSPAIDAGDNTAAPPTDQRGFPRPAGLASDIGAYEFDPLDGAPKITTPPYNQTVASGFNVEFSVIAAGSPTLMYQWFFNGTNSISNATNSLLELTDVQRSQSGAYTVVVTNAVAAVTSAPAILTVLELAPTIVTAPLSQVAAIGTTASFSAVASGSLPLGYHWYFKSTNILAGATESLLQLTGVQLSESGAYTVVVTNAFGAVTSPPAILTVFGVAPTVITAPQDRTASFGTTVDVSVSAAGSPPLSYQWLKGGARLSGGGNVSGAQTATLTLSNVFGGNAGGYSAIVSNAFGSVTSVVATLTVIDPYISGQPADQFVLLDSNVTFSVVAVGTLPLNYQWQHNGANVADNVRISGSQLPILAIAHMQAGDIGDYRVVLTNVFGAITSSTARLTFVTTNRGEVRFNNTTDSITQIRTNNAPNGWTPDLSGTNAGTAAGKISGPIGTYMFALFYAPPSVTTVEGGNPWTDPNWAFTGNYATNIGSPGRISGNYNPDFSVSIPGYAPGSSASLVIIGWNTAVGGTTLASFETAWNQQTAGLYYGYSSVADILLGNGGDIPNITILGDPASELGQISGFVMAPIPVAPTVAVSPQSQTAGTSSTVHFSAIASGSPPLSYQWLKGGARLSDGGNLLGAQTATLTLSNVFGNDAGGYSVIVSNVYGSVTSVVATLTVIDPNIITQPVDQIVMLDSNGTFTVVSIGTSPLSYQWRHNGTNLADNVRISGSHLPMLAIAHVRAGDAGDYSVVLTNAFGVITSRLARLSLTANQAEVGFNTTAASITQIRTNNVPNGWTPDLSGTNAGTAFGLISGPSGTYMFALFSAPTNVTAVAGGTPWTDPNWGFTGNYATNTGIPGRMYGNYNPDFSVSILGYAPGSSASLVVIGWNTAVGGTTLTSFATAWNQHAAGLYYGYSSVGNLRLGNGSDIPNFTIFGNPTTGWGQVSGFVMGPVVRVPPTVEVSPESQTAETGTIVEFKASATGIPAPNYQWFHNSSLLTACNNSVLHLPSVQAFQAGAYTVAASNIAGSVTSAPAMLNVIPVVERKPVLGIRLTGGVGSELNVDYANTLTPALNWTALGSVSLISTSQFYFDLTTPLPPQRFYRAWQMGTPSVVPSLNLNFVPAITLTGNVGDSVRVDYINAIGPTDAWVTLDTVTLTNTSQLYFDVSAPGQPTRLYRIVPMP